MWRWFGRSGLSVGRQGEKLAAGALKAAGARILARNYRCPVGEADLIALHAGVLVFAEVKTRRSETFADPTAAVGARKRRQCRKVARYYLQQTGRDDLPVRFDVFAIVLPADGRPKIRHIVDAFR